MAIPPRPLGPIFDIPAAPAAPGAPAGGGLPAAPPINGRGSGTYPYYMAPEGSTRGGIGYTPIPADAVRYQKPAFFNWGPYANGSWLAGQFPQGSPFQQLIQSLAQGMPQPPAAPAAAPRSAAPAPAPAPAPLPGFTQGPWTDKDFPLLEGLLGRKLGPVPIPPPNYVV